MHVAVALEAIFQAFFQDDRDGFVDGVEHIDGGGVVVEAFLAPVLADKAEVEIPALDFGFAGKDFLHRLGA